MSQRAQKPLANSRTEPRPWERPTPAERDRALYLYALAKLPAALTSLFDEQTPYAYSLMKDEEGNIAGRAITPVDPMLGYPFVRVLQCDNSASQASGNDAATLNYGTFADLNEVKNYVGNKSTAKWERLEYATASKTVTGASPVTVAAAGTGKYRIYGGIIGSSAAGVVVLGDGATIMNVTVGANQSVPFSTSVMGFLQPTNTAAITATLAAATLTVTLFTDDGSN